MKKVVILVIMLVVLTGCSKQSDKWTGFYYPEGEPKQGKAKFETQEFETKDICEKWANEKTQSNEKAAYFCGFQCNYDSSGQYACNDVSTTVKK